MRIDYKVIIFLNSKKLKLMTPKEIEELIVNKHITTSDIVINFNANKTFAINQKGDIINGEYYINIRDGLCYLITNPPIVGAYKELPIGLFIGFCREGDGFFIQ